MDHLSLESGLHGALSSFPATFRWGVATASYQIEGSAHTDGRGESIWDRYARTPGMVLGGMTGDVACDSWRRWKEDIELCRRLGVGSYRFSIAWPRIQPEGRGIPCQAGLDGYKRIAEGLLAAGIEPAATLYHWDLPQALEDRGGWPERDTALRFGEYASIVMQELGSLIGRWFTVNEPWCSAFLGYYIGRHAPGRQDRVLAYRAAHHLLLAHGLAVQARNGICPQTPIGIVLNTSTPRPATSRPEDVEAADRAADEPTALWMDPLYGRGYPERLLAAYPEVVMPVMDGDLDLIASHCDFIGLNYYFETAVEAAPVEAATPEGFRATSSPWRRRTEMGWDIVPGGMLRLLKNVVARWPVPRIFITENGCACPDAVDSDGSIRDSDRIAYMASHLEACARAMAEGVPLEGYYAWSLLDNFEWAYGYSKRFGLVHVDFASGRRTPKDSYWFYRDLVAGGL